MLTRSLFLPCCCLAATVATGTHDAAASPDWDAQWIWQDADGPANTWMAFRKTFYLGKAPDEAVAKIAVDSKYWIWINGKLARFEGGISGGPRQSAAAKSRSILNWSARKERWPRWASPSRLVKSPGSQSIVKRFGTTSASPAGLMASPKPAKTIHTSCSGSRPETGKSPRPLSNLLAHSPYYLP